MPGRPGRQRKRSKKAGTGRRPAPTATRAAARATKPKMVPEPVRTQIQRETLHVDSPTAVAAEVLRTGVTHNHPPRHQKEISREDDAMRVGDPDDSGLLNEYVGEDTPGGSSPTPDQNGVDEIGRVYGLQEEDSGALRSSAEVLARRDRHRTELRAPRRPQP